MAKLKLSKKLLQAGEAGDAETQYDLYCCYRYGLGVERSVEKADYWEHRAADNGHAEAQWELSFDYDGSFGEREYDKCIHYLELAAAQDHPGALFKLSCYYNWGTGVEKNVRKSLRLLRRAVRIGNYSAY